ncbi:MAG: quinol:cytochrome C oxidoreductase [Bacteroidota bacterium]
MELEEERYIFQPRTKTTLMIVAIVGVLFLVLGMILPSGEHHEAGSGGGEEHHATATVDQKLVASSDVAAEPQQEHGDHEAVAKEGGEEHEVPGMKQRVFASLWHNSVFFTGLGIIGLFFIAIQYAAQAGWSAPLKRIPLAMGSWIPIAGVIMIILWFVVKHDVFHWTHSYLYDKNGGHYDKILDGKSALWFLPLAAGSFPVFYVFRMVLFFGLWYMFFVWIRREMLAEDLNGGVGHWLNARKLSAIFLVIFAVSSSIAAWDWVMSIDPHWFSTMMGWYVFASWWVTGLAVIGLIVASLKDAGYLKVVNGNHLHDLGKFIFGFSIFWMYIWFSQFMLIYYANLPEETVYFIERKYVSPYSWVFITNLIMNFVLPFLLLMTRDAKRHTNTLKVICPIVILGHWFDFYNMVTPGVMKTHGAFGLVEIGILCIFAAAFLFVTLTSLAKYPLVAKNDPMMGEALNHHI